MHSTGTGHWASGLRVLVVEDEALIALDLERRLMRLGFASVDVRNSGEGALEALALRPTDLVLMDIHIRGAIDGIETARLIRQVDDVPVIFLTAFADEATVQRAAETSASGYLLKPVDDGALAATVRVAVERHRRETHARLLETAVTGAGVGIGLAAVTEDGPCLVYANAAYARLNGESIAGVLGRRPVLNVLEPRDPAFEAFESALDARAPGQWEVACRIGAHHRNWQSLSLSPVVDGRGRTTHMLLVQKDVTSEREAVRALTESQRLQVAARLTAGVAHDFNNVLAAILALGEVAMLDSMTAQARADVQEIVNAARRGTLLTRKLMDFARRQDPSQVGATDLTRVLCASSAITTQFLGRNIDFEILADDMPAWVTLDATSIEQVYLNLVVNARDALPEGGRIRVHVEVDEETLGGVVRLRVVDDGVGMDAATRAHLFEPLFTTKAPGAGTGLGLSTSALLVERAGGTIRVESAPGQGSTFTVELPLAAAPFTPVAAFDTLGPADKTDTNGMTRHTA
jgi:signal transduction histidine kinase